MSNHANNQMSPDRPSRIIRFDKGYLMSMPGILKLSQVTCNLIGFICIKISSAWVSPILYNTLYWVGNIITAFLLLMYVFHFVEKFDKIPWLKFELYYCCAMCIAYVGCSIFAVTLAESVGYSVGFFGFCAIIAYGLDGYLKFKANKRGLPPQ